MTVKSSPEDNQQLITEGVYRGTTTTETIIEDPSNSTLNLIEKFYTRVSFESRGLINVIASTLIVTFLLFAFLFVHVWYTSSYFFENESKTLKEIQLSSWETAYDLPDDIPLLELHTSTFNFDSIPVCPEGKFALVLYIENPISTFEQWMKTCGPLVNYFRLNGDPEIEDIDKIIKFVPNAQYIPIKAYLKVAKSDDILADPEFQNNVKFDGSIVNSLTISGFMTSKMIQEVLEISPFVEELTIEGTQICTSLVRLPKLSKDTCEVNWSELRKLKIIGTEECVRTFEFIDMCFSLTKIESFEVSGSIIDNVSVRYIEDVIDRYRITKVKFEDNICSDEIKENHEYICGDSYK